MNRIIIIGAGATKGSYVAEEVHKPNSNIPLPPLVGDFSNVFNHDFISLNQTQDGSKVGKIFNELLDLTETKKQVEELQVPFAKFCVYDKDCPFPQRQ